MKQLKSFHVVKMTGAALLTAALLPAAAQASLIVNSSYHGESCYGSNTCVDLATAGYDVSGGGLVNPAISVNNQYKTPGTDTGNQGSVTSYNVTSSQDNPTGAITPVEVTNLNNFFGLYWGSIDSYNYIDFFQGDTLLTSFGGQDAVNEIGASGAPSNFNTDAYFTFMGIRDAIPIGKDGSNGQLDDEINLPFDRVVLRSTGGVAFEFATAAVPEPGTLALLGLGLLGLGAARRRKA